VKQSVIPVCRPILNGNEETYLRQAIVSGQISSLGNYVEKFESLFSAWIGMPYGAACTSGTSAMYLAFQAIGVKPGDRIVFPSFTMMGSVFPAVALGATPVFLDVCPDTWTLDVSSLDKVRGPIKAVVPVHIFGHPCDMDPLINWAKEHSVSIIEDAAEAHGATYKGQKVGTFSDVSVFSFYANKILTTGEGGMALTKELEISRRLKDFRNLCLSSNPEERFIHQEIGLNFRMTNLQAALGVAQTERADFYVEQKRSMALKYFEALKGLETYIQLPVEKPWAKNVFWMFGIEVRDDISMTARELCQRMRVKDIETRRFFYPGHLQPALKGKFEQISCPVSEKLWEKGLYLPSSSDLSPDEVSRVAQALKEIFQG
jgi:perosamine synthetase